MKKTSNKPAATLLIAWCIWFGLACLFQTVAANTSKRAHDGDTHFYWSHVGIVWGIGAFVLLLIVAAMSTLDAK